MTYVRTISILTAVAATTMASSVWAASDKEHDSHHPAAAAAIQVAQATPAAPGMGMGMGMGGSAAMPGQADQLKAMQVMHDKMLAAKTPEERNALMAEQMGLMQNSMGMMGRMGRMGQGAMAGKPGDMAARQGMMEQRMDMMHSTMQLMMDRMAPAPAPATK